MSLIPANNILAKINLINFSCVKTYTEEQFHKELLQLIAHNSITIEADTDYLFFIKWYQKVFNQSRRNYITYKDLEGNIISIETPYTFGFINKKEYITFLSAEQAYHIFMNYTCDTNKYVPHFYRKHRFAYRNAPNKHTSEKYYAKLADIKFDKSLGQPVARGGHQKNLDKSYYSDWELEGRSEVGNWKSDTKLRHQYLVNVVKKRNHKHKDL